MRAVRRSSAACHTARCTSTPERLPAGGSRWFPQHRQHQLERRGIGRNPKPIAASQQQFDGCCCFLSRFALHQREADGCVLFPQPPTPPVEGGLLQLSLTTVCADRLATAFLLRDSLAP